MTGTLMLRICLSHIEKIHIYIVEQKERKTKEWRWNRHRTGVRWNLTMVLICVSLITNDAEHSLFDVGSETSSGCLVQAVFELCT